ncbi:MAG: DNA polymerase III subunit gamma/tau, partial [Sphingomonadales bacterium]
MSDSFLGLDEPPQPRDSVYRVLARKYRPQTFAQLIGQDAMVQTLGNAIKRDRLAHAFLLTGVRGVGKTSTARLIAKALNCIGPDGQGGPTIDPCGVCEPCRAIAEGRHIDVIEMDAASHTGVDDVREIIDASRYSAVSARYKIYIIDEVHMLSKNAFNALLKTLEEPPGHVKFLFATTEVQKVPVTVLSRCQRFDLRRIPADKLAAHFGEVVEKEGAQAEPEALAMIARAAEGSARDGLSILDQAIAHAGMEGGAVTADAVRDMLGLSDRNAIRDLFGLVIAGDAAGALAALRGQYDLGVDPQAVLKSLLEMVHRVTLAKLGNEVIPGQAAEESASLGEWAGKLGFPALHRLWQLLLKGHDEVIRAALPIEACEMALLRVIHASTLPDPGELARKIAEGAPMGGPAPAAAPSAPAEAPAPRNMAQLVERLA